MPLIFVTLRPLHLLFLVFLIIFAGSSLAWGFGLWAGEPEIKKSQMTRAAEYVVRVVTDSVTYPCAEVILDTIETEGDVIIYLRSMNQAGEFYTESFLMLPDSAAAYNLVPFKRGDCADAKRKH